MDGKRVNDLRDATSSLGDDAWTTDHRLQGVSWVHVRLRQHPFRRSFNRIPNLTFLVRGIKITWPGQDDPIWTENAAAIRYWWLINRRQLPAESIDENSVRQAIDLCDEIIRFEIPDPISGENVPASASRYTINGVIRSGDDATTIEQDMDFAWQGYAPESSGSIVFRPGADRPISAVIGPDDIIESNRTSPEGALQDRFNAATMSIAQSRSHGWLQYSLPELENTAAIASDGLKISEHLGTNAFIADPITAHRMLAIALRRITATLTATYTLKAGENLRNFQLRPTDWVRVNDPENGFVNETFFVSRVVIDELSRVLVDLVQQPSGVYEDSIRVPEDNDPNIQFPITMRVPAPTGFTVSSAPVPAQDGPIAWRITGEWDASTFDARMEVISDSTGAIITNTSFRDNQASVDVPTPDTYRVVLRHVSRDGRASNSVTRLLTINSQEIEVPRLVLAGSELVNNVLRITTRPVDARDIAGIDVRFQRTDVGSTQEIPVLTARQWEQAPIADAPVVSPLTGRIPIYANITLPTAGRYRIFARFVNNSGNYGPITDLFYFIFEPPITGSESFQAWPAWEGTTSNTTVWDLDGEFRLYPTPPDRTRVTLRRWNGLEGWPFGRVERYNQPMTDASTYYETQLIDLNRVSELRVSSEVQLFTPAGQAVTPQSDYDIYCYHAPPTGNPRNPIPARSAFNRTLLSRTGATAIPSSRYLYMRIHFRRWRGSAIDRFSTEVSFV